MLQCPGACPFSHRHDKVAWVNYPGLEENAGFATAKRLYNNKFGGILTFGLPDRDMAFRFINGLRLAKNLANIGDAKTLVIHPASTICVISGRRKRSSWGSVKRWSGFRSGSRR